MRVLATVALAGCVAGGVRVADSQLSSFTAGETTKAQVIATIGAPTMQMRPCRWHVNGN